MLNKINKTINKVHKNKNKNQNHNMKKQTKQKKSKIKKLLTHNLNLIFLILKHYM